MRASGHGFWKARQSRRRVLAHRGSWEGGLGFAETGRRGLRPAGGPALRISRGPVYALFRGPVSAATIPVGCDAGGAPWPRPRAPGGRPTGPSLAGWAKAPAGQSTEKGPAALGISQHPGTRRPEDQRDGVRRPSEHHEVSLGRAKRGGGASAAGSAGQGSLRAPDQATAGQAGRGSPRDADWATGSLDMGRELPPVPGS